jgi:hypothetical protein
MRRGSVVKIAAVGAGLLGLVSLVAHKRPIQDAWYVDGPHCTDRASQLESTRVLRVVDQYQTVAQDRLATVSFTHVSLEEAARFCVCMPPDVGTWGLTRSISFAPSSDYIEVFDCDGELTVHRGALGPRGRMQREALLVAPISEPREVRPVCVTAR